MNPTDPPQTYAEALAAIRTPRLRAFVERYLETLNQSKAARLAGYSEKTAHAIGFENLRKPDVALAVELGMAERTMGQSEVLARIDEIARATFDDFITLEEVEYSERIPIPAFQRRELLRARAADALEQAESTAEPENAVAWRKIAQDAELEIERLPENPLETITVLGEVRRAVVARVDLVKAERLGKLHLIKKLKQTDRGLEVELYQMDNALRDLGRHYKLFSDRVSLENADGSPIKFIAGLSDADF